MKRILGGPGLAAAALLLVGAILFYKGWRQVAGGICAGFFISFFYLFSLRFAVARSSLAGRSAILLKALLAGRLFLLGLILFAMAYFWPSSLWGFLAAFTIVLVAFLVDTLMVRRGG